MKLCVAAVLTVFVFCITCDPTRASPSRQRRQGWSWGDDETIVEPPRPTPAPSSSSAAPPVASSTQNPTQCMAACQSTSEFNPVCGSNRVTYENIGKLNCARKCGVAVERVFTGTCSPAPAS